MMKFFRLINQDSIQLCNYNDSLYLLFISKNNNNNEQHKFFLRVPNSISICRDKTSLKISSNNFSQLTSFIKLIKTSKDMLYKKSKKVLVLRGLGYKMFLDSDKIVFKLGTSHQVYKKIPKDLNVIINKNLLVLEAHSKILLGHYAASILKLTRVDVYKNKGFSYKYSHQRLKPVKKK